MPSLDISVSITKITIVYIINTATVTSKISTNYSNSVLLSIKNSKSTFWPIRYRLLRRLPIRMLRHSAAGENSECVVFGQAVFQASHSLVPANTACYAGYTSIGTTVSIYVLVYLKLWFEKNEKPNFENSVKISDIYENRIFFHNNFLGAGFGAALHEIFGAEKLRDSPWLIFPFCDEIF